MIQKATEGALLFMLTIFAPVWPVALCIAFFCVGSVSTRYKVFLLLRPSVASIACISCRWCVYTASYISSLLRHLMASHAHFNIMVVSACL